MVTFRFPIVSFTNQAVKNWITFCVLFFLSLVAQLVKNLPAMQETPLYFWVRKIPWRRDRLPTPVLLGFPCGSDGKESAHNTGDLGLTPGLGRFPREENSYPLQYSGLENSIGSIVHVVAKSWTGLSLSPKLICVSSLLQFIYTQHGTQGPSPLRSLSF